MAIRKEITYLHIAKALGIIAMVMGHCDLLTNFVYQFHMPLFFFISGFLHRDDNTLSLRNLLDFFRRKIKSYYIPYLKVTILFLIVLDIYGQNWFILNPCPLQDITWFYFFDRLTGIMLLSGRNLSQMLGAIWFLRYLLIISMLFELAIYIWRFYQKLFGMRYSVIMLILFLLIFILLLLLQIHKPVIMVPESGILLLVYFAYYFAGYVVMNSFYVSSFFIKIIASPWSLSLFLIPIISSYVSKGYHDLLWFPITYLFAFSGIMALLTFSNLCDNKLETLRTMLIFIGKNTFYILVWHFTFFKIITCLQILIYGLPWEKASAFPILPCGFGWRLAYLCIGVAGPLGLGFVFNRFKLAFLQSIALLKQKLCSNCVFL